MDKLYPEVCLYAYPPTRWVFVNVLYVLPILSMLDIIFCEDFNTTFPGKVTYKRDKIMRVNIFAQHLSW